MLSLLGRGSIPGRGTKIPQAAQRGQKKKKKGDNRSSRGAIGGLGRWSSSWKAPLPTWEGKSARCVGRRGWACLGIWRGREWEGWLPLTLLPSREGTLVSQSPQRPQPPNPCARERLRERALAEALALPGSCSEVPGPLAASSQGARGQGTQRAAAAKLGPGVRGAGGPGPWARVGHKGLQQREGGVHKKGPPGEGRASGQREALTL